MLEGSASTWGRLLEPDMSVIGNALLPAIVREVPLSVVPPPIKDTAEKMSSGMSDMLPYASWLGSSSTHSADEYDDV